MCIYLGHGFKESSGINETQAPEKVFVKDTIDEENVLQNDTIDEHNVEQETTDNNDSKIT